MKNYLPNINIELYHFHSPLIASGKEGIMVEIEILGRKKRIAYAVHEDNVSVAVEDALDGIKRDIFKICFKSE